jgi:hypothetical protein
MDACNRFGESVLHMACRRGATPMVAFLMADCGLQVNISDDFGRTPLHGMKPSPSQRERLFCPPLCLACAPPCSPTPAAAAATAFLDGRRWPRFNLHNLTRLDSLLNLSGRRVLDAHAQL